MPAVSPAWRRAGWRIFSYGWACVFSRPVRLRRLPLRAGRRAACSTRGSISAWWGSSIRIQPAKRYSLTLRRLRRQLGQPLPPIRFGESAQDVRRFRIGAVMIKRHPPPDTLILFTRARSVVWRLVDDAHGRLKIVRVAPAEREM